MSTLERSNSVENSENIITLPKPSLRLVDAIASIVGLVIGAGIFETPALVAANSNSEFAVLQVWGLGGVISIVGALCYAELATTYPHIGGSYDYLKRAFGQSIALLAFVFGDYASQIFSLGNFSAGIYAALAIALLTALNILGVQHSKRLQNWLTITTILGLLAIIVIGLILPPGTNSPASAPATAVTRSWGSAMVFVLLSYGGWNEAAHISAEIENYRRNIVRSLLWGLGIITAVYLLINLAYLKSLGLAGMAQSPAVADSPQERLRQRLRPFRVPLYPILPLLFCAACGYLLYSSLVFTGTGAIVGVVVVVLGIPFVIRHRQQTR